MIFAYINYGEFRGPCRSCGPKTREGRGIFNSKLMFLFRTASLTSSPSKPAMLGEWSLHSFPGLLRPRDAFTANTFALLNCLQLPSIAFISPTYLLPLPHQSVPAEHLLIGLIASKHEPKVGLLPSNRHLHQKRIWTTTTPNVRRTRS